MSPRPSTTRCVDEPLERGDRDDGGDAGRDRHRHGEDVVDQQRRAGDERRALAEVLAAHDVGAATARVGEDRLAVRRDDDREQDGDDDRDRDELVEAERQARCRRHATTNRISSVAYAVDEIASDENTASAMVFGRRWCSCSVVAMRPADQQPLQAEYTLPRDSIGGSGRADDPAAAPGQYAHAAASLIVLRRHTPAVRAAWRARCTWWSSAAAGSGPARRHAREVRSHGRRDRQERNAFRQLPEAFAGARSSASGSTATTSRQAGIEAPARWPPSPTATTPTSSSPGSPARPSGSSAWSPASTTRAGP